MGKMIKVDLDDYIYLKNRDLKLEYLECGGVDNWSGYGEALYPDDDEDEIDLDEAVEAIRKELTEEYK